MDMDMDTFTFADVEFKDENMQDTSLEELRGSLPIFSPLRFTQKERRHRTPPQDMPCSKRPKQTDGFHKSLSFGDYPVHQPSTDIQNAVNRLMDVDNIIGNGTDAFCLPTVKGKHADLKSIHSSTLVALHNGFYEGVVNGYQIIDCRYPYEYNGGHIQLFRGGQFYWWRKPEDPEKTTDLSQGAHNIYAQSGILQFLLEHQTNKQPDVLIFHCEYSSERAPKLCRYLRNKDREINSDKYPYLTFPELYILDGGYKEFYHSHKIFCEPINYIPMLHQDHTADIRHFRSKSKSWTAGEKRKSPQRLMF